MRNVSENITSYNSVFCTAFAMATVQHFCKISKTTSAVTILTSGCLNAGGAFLVSKSPIQDKYKFVLTISVVALGSISSCGLEKISKKFSISKTANRTLSLSLVSSTFVGHVLEKRTQRMVRQQKVQTLRAVSSTSAPEGIEAYRGIEAKDFRLTQAVRQFDLDNLLGDETLDLYNEDYRELFHLDAYICPDVLEDKGMEDKIGELLRSYRGKSNSLAYYTQRIFGLLLKAKREWNSLEDSEEKDNQIPDLSAWIKSTCKGFIDAHKNCDDQVSSQLQTLAIEAAIHGTISSEIVGALTVMDYTNQLIKTMVYQDDPGYCHQADLERQVQQRIPGKLNLPTSRIHTHVAHHMASAGIVNRVLDAVARQYKPAEYLIDGLNSTRANRLFTAALAWYNDKFFAPLQDERGEIREGCQQAYDRLVSAVGGEPDDCDFAGLTQEAKMYFLVQNKIITPQIEC